MFMRRHVMLALLSAGFMVGGTAGPVKAETLVIPETPAIPEASPLAQVLAAVQKESPSSGLQRAAPKPAAAPPVVESPPAVAAPPSVAVEAPPVYAPPAAPIIAASGERPIFQFLPLLPSAADLEASPALWPLLGSQNLGAPHDAVTRAVIIIHNADRDAEAGLTRLQKLAGAVASGPDARTLILAPLFPTGAELPAFKSALGAVARNLAVWSADNWAYGGDSIVTEPQRPISSMLALDILLLYLADQKSFPSLRNVVIAGAGSGGDLVQRYALYGRAPDILAEQKLALRFVVAGAQSYAYMTEARPRADAAGFAPPSEAALKECAAYQDYPYGLEAPNTYAQQTSADSVRQNYPTRDVVYLYGAQDTQPALDQNCAAKLLGSSVKARAENYERYLQSLFPDARGQRFAALPGVNGGDKIWGSTCGVSVLFADGDCVKN